MNAVVNLLFSSFKIQRGNKYIQITNTNYKNKILLGPCGRDCMVVGFTTTCAVSAYHH